jgi:hypothetical protein
MRSSPSPLLPHELVEGAVQWALTRLGEARYRGLCYLFVEDAYEHGNGVILDGQGRTAHEAAVAYACRKAGPPPRGSYVFFDAVCELEGELKNWGHMGLSLGDGRIVHAWDVVRVDAIEAVERLEVPPTWTRPAYLGWTPVERILVNARPSG